MVGLKINELPVLSPTIHGRVLFSSMQKTDAHPTQKYKNTENAGTQMNADNHRWTQIFHISFIF